MAKTFIYTQSQGQIRYFVCVCVLFIETQAHTNYNDYNITDCCTVYPLPSSYHC